MAPDIDSCNYSFLEFSVETTLDSGLGDGSATASVEGGEAPYSYAWFAGDSEEAFADSMSVDSLFAGDYSVLAVDSTGCIGTLDFVIDITDGTEEVDLLWRVFPNPATDALHVSLVTPGEGQLTLIDLGGRIVLNQTIVGSRTTLDLSGLSIGTYILQFKQGDSLHRHNIQVMR